MKVCIIRRIKRGDIEFEVKEWEDIKEPLNWKADLISKSMWFMPVAILLMFAFR